MSRLSCRAFLKGLGIGVGLAMLAAMLAGCAQERGSRFANLPPDTFISLGPSHQSCNPYRVEVHWYGTDIDGQVNQFEIATTRGVESSLDTLSLGSLAWGTTSSFESTFVVPADSCCTQDSIKRYATSTWGILVRSVDNEGARDPEPANLFFRACNQLPRVRLTHPEHGASCDKLPCVTCGTPYLEWAGADADGDLDKLVYKYLVTREADIAGGAWPPAEGTPPPWLPPLEHDSAGVDHAAPPVGYWSKWVNADCTYVNDIDLSDYAGTGERLAIFVTVKDEGGAILPETLFRTYNLNRNWVIAKPSPTSSGGVPITIDADYLGERSSSNPADYETRVGYVFEGTKVLFWFWGNEDVGCRSVAEAYRYYYDSPDTPTWTSWGSVAPLRGSSQTIPWFARYPADGTPFVPTPGEHVLVVEVRDLEKRVTHCQFRFEVVPGPAGQPRGILLVDDDIAKWLTPPYPGYEQASDSLWAEILEPYNYGTFDTGSGTPPFTNPVPPRTVGSATTVIWAVDEDSQASECQLTQVCRANNYLDSYVKAGGNLIVIGRTPIYACGFWPGRAPEIKTYVPATVAMFAPEQWPGDSSLVYNFNWETFGIERMARLEPDVPTWEIWPCEDSWPHLTTGLIPGVGGWPGKLDNIFFITNVRQDAEIEVHRLYTTVPLSGEGLPGVPDCNARWIGVYVPPDGNRGGAAYIAVPPWFFDADGVSAMIRQLLEVFGEPQVNPQANPQANR